MKLKLEEMKEVARRLPVGYYLGAKVPVEIEEGQAAYADMVKREIHIGLALLQSAADAITPADAAKWDREKLLRCLLYHEISHLLLTPNWALNIKLKTPKGGTFRNSHDLVNIFEDERIETLLRGRFLDADFAAFKRLAIKPIAKPKTPAEKMLMAVRLRRTTPRISKMIDEAIRMLWDIDVRGGSMYIYKHYLQSIVDAVLASQEQEQQSQEQPQQQQSQGQEQSQEQEQGQEQGQSQSGDGGDEQPDEEAQSGGDEQPGEEERAEASAAGGRDPGNSIDLRELWSSMATAPSGATAAALNRFATRLAKKRGAQSAGMWSALHGRISPKRDALDKDRIFRRVSDVGANINQSVNLVLWVDCSGSFWASETKLNQILASVADAERMSAGKLHVQVVHMTDHACVALPGKWNIVARGNNCIDHTFVEAWQATRDRTRRNIDIVVFDGACIGSWCLNSLDKMLKGCDGAEYKKWCEGVIASVQKIWGSRDCHIISDTNNQPLFDRIPHAHKTYITDEYAEHLEAEVIKTLDRVL